MAVSLNHASLAASLLAVGVGVAAMVRGMPASAPAAVGSASASVPAPAAPPPPPPCRVACESALKGCLHVINCEEILRERGVSCDKPIPQALIDELGWCPGR